jgi:hypothetical protein
MIEGHQSHRRDAFPFSSAQFRNAAGTSEQPLCCVTGRAPLDVDLTVRRNGSVSEVPALVCLQ